MREWDVLKYSCGKLSSVKFAKQSFQPDLKPRAAKNTAYLILMLTRTKTT